MKHGTLLTGNSVEKKRPRKYNIMGFTLHKAGEATISSTSIQDKIPPTPCISGEETCEGYYLRARELLIDKRTQLETAFPNGDIGIGKDDQNVPQVRITYGSEFIEPFQGRLKTYNNGLIMVPKRRDFTNDALIAAMGKFWKRLDDVQKKVSSIINQHGFQSKLEYTEKGAKLDVLEKTGIKIAEIGISIAAPSNFPTMLVDVVFSKPEKDESPQQHTWENISDQPLGQNEDVINVSVLAEKLKQLRAKRKPIIWQGRGW